VPRAVISLGGVGNLATFARFVPVLCGPGIVERLAPADGLAEISPAALKPSAGSIIMVSGMLDRLVPPWVAHDYARYPAREVRDRTPARQRAGRRAL
jgi:hypothetical protein